MQTLIFMFFLTYVQNNSISADLQVYPFVAAKLLPFSMALCSPQKREIIYWTVFSIKDEDNVYSLLKITFRYKKYFNKTIWSKIFTTICHIMKSGCIWLKYIKKNLLFSGFEPSLWRFYCCDLLEHFGSVVIEWIDYTDLFKLPTIFIIILI